MISKQKLNYSWNRKHKKDSVMFVISDSRLNMAKACLLMPLVYSLVATVNTVKCVHAENWDARMEVG